MALDTVSAIAVAMVSFVEIYGQKKLRGSGLFSQPSKVLAISVMCGWNFLEASLSGQASIQDATAPPTVHPDRYKTAPRSIAFKLRRSRKRSTGGDGYEDEFDEQDAIGFFGSSDGGGWGSSGGGGGENGRGGWDFWGDNWDEEWRWKQHQNNDYKTFGLLYQAACWISFTHCLHYAVHRVISFSQTKFVDDSSASGDTATFSHCASCSLRTT